MFLHLCNQRVYVFGSVVCLCADREGGRFNSLARRNGQPRTGPCMSLTCFTKSFSYCLFGLFLFCFFVSFPEGWQLAEGSRCNWQKAVDAIAMGLGQL